MIGNKKIRTIVERVFDELAVEQGAVNDNRQIAKLYGGRVLNRHELASIQALVAYAADMTWVTHAVVSAAVCDFTGAETLDDISADHYEDAVNFLCDFKGVH